MLEDSFVPLGRAGSLRQDPQKHNRIKDKYDYIKIEIYYI